LRLAVQLLIVITSALKARTGGGRHDRSSLVEISLNLTALHLCLEDLLLLVGGVLGSPAKPGGDTEGVLDGLVSSNIVDTHLDRTLVPGTAEPGDDLLRTPGDGGRTTLLEADYVSSETEAEVARIVSGDLLGGNVNLVLEEASPWSDTVKVD